MAGILIIKPSSSPSSDGRFMSLAQREFPGPKSSVAKATPLAGGKWSKPVNQVAHDSFATGAGAWWLRRWRVK